MTDNDVLNLQDLQSMSDKSIMHDLVHLWRVSITPSSYSVMALLENLPDYIVLQD